MRTSTLVIQMPSYFGKTFIRCCSYFGKTLSDAVIFMCRTSAFSAYIRTNLFLSRTSQVSFAYKDPNLIPVQLKASCTLCRLLTLNPIITWIRKGCKGTKNNNVFSLANAREVRRYATYTSTYSTAYSMQCRQCCFAGHSILCTSYNIQVNSVHWLPLKRS